MTSTIPLAHVPPGKSVKIVRIEGGPHLTSRLYQMGLVPGTTAKVLMNGRGPVIIKVRNVSIALGRGMAYKVFVTIVKGDIPEAQQ